MTASTVQEVLQGYASRGLLRNFEASGDGFGFLWMNHRPMRLQWKPANRTLVFKDLAPNVPARGRMDREIRDFLSGLAAADRPPHRRVDPAEYELFCENRGSQLSVGLRLKGGSEAAAAEKLMLVVHELFLFMHDQWLEYMHEEFGASLE